MVIPSRLPEYIVAAMVIILAPGPSVLFVIARAIAWGRKTAVFTVAGNVTGAFALSTLVAVGLGPILQRSDLAYAAIQWGGSLYLMYLGVEAIRQRKFTLKICATKEMLHLESHDLCAMGFGLVRLIQKG